jgi:mannose-6-phosphate isomerase-like protein (cupin superfamily)
VTEPIFGQRSLGGSGHLKGEASRCFLTGERTGGLFSLTESVMEPGTEQAPLHVHSLEDETFYVIEGRIVAIVGERQEEIGAGGSVYLPRGIPHRIQSAGDKTIRVLMLIAPAGLEKFFVEIDALNAEGKLDGEAMTRTAARYGVTILGGSEWRT